MFFVCLALRGNAEGVKASSCQRSLLTVRLKNLAGLSMPSHGCGIGLAGLGMFRQGGGVLPRSAQVAQGPKCVRNKGRQAALANVAAAYVA